MRTRQNLRTGRAAGWIGVGALGVALAFAALLFGAPEARALTVAPATLNVPGLGDITPAYFNPKNVPGLASGQGFSPSFTVPLSWTEITICNPLAAGCSNPDVEVTSQTLGTIYQRPQDNGQTPSVNTPYVADVLFKLTLKTALPNNGSGMTPLYLVFGAVVSPYQFDPPTALDLGTLAGVTPLDILSLGGSELYPALLLTGLNQVGDMLTFTSRYVIAGQMQPNAVNGYDLPPIALSGFVVPEPSSALLLLGGLLGAAYGLRGRSDRC